MDKKAMYNLSYGLFVLTARADGKDSGCIINTAGQVTSSPNRISIAVNKDNLTHDVDIRHADAVRTAFIILQKVPMPISVPL